MLTKVIENLIICPVCEDNGVISTLAQLENNQLVVKQKRDNYFIKIGGDNLTLTCGRCSQTVYFKQSK